MSEHTGFDTPVHNATHLASGGQDSMAVEGTGSLLSAGVLQPESATSILIISVLWVVRFYFVVIAFAFARNVVRDSAAGEAPFSGRKDGEGWKGRLGRGLVKLGGGYWKGEDGWERFGSKFRRSEDGRGGLPPV